MEMGVDEVRFDVVLLQHETFVTAAAFLNCGRSEFGDKSVPMQLY
jgi:hypothetical protein